MAEAAPGALSTSAMTIKAAEAEAGTLYVAGEAPAGTLVRVFANDELGRRGARRGGGHLAARGEKEVPVGRGRVPGRSGAGGGEEAEPDRRGVCSVHALRGWHRARAGRDGASAGSNGSLSDAGSLPTPNYVIIRRGDNLWRIARRNYGRGIKYQAIYAANRDRIRNPHWIFPGQVFVVPTRDRSWETRRSASSTTSAAERRLLSSSIDDRRLPTIIRPAQFHVVVNERLVKGGMVERVDAAERLKALGHPVRLAIVRALAEQSCCCCADVCSRLPLAQSTVSQHLKVLKEAGLISFRRDGVRSSYVLNPSAFAALNDRPGGHPLAASAGARNRFRSARGDLMAGDAPKITADSGRTFSDAVEPLAVYVAVRPAGPEAPRRHRLRSADRRQARRRAWCPIPSNGSPMR